MFKTASCEQEIFESMKKHLVANKVENKYNFNRLAKVIDYLNSAAQSFEKAGMESEAQEIVNIINEIR